MTDKPIACLCCEGHMDEVLLSDGTRRLVCRNWECGCVIETPPPPPHISWQQRAIEEFLAEDADEH